MGIELFQIGSEEKGDRAKITTADQINLAQVRREDSFQTMVHLSFETREWIKQGLRESIEHLKDEMIYQVKPAQKKILLKKLNRLIGRTSSVRIGLLEGEITQEN